MREERKSAVEIRQIRNRKMGEGKERKVDEHCIHACLL